VKAAPSDRAREFEATPVAELISIANQGAARPIRLADASLAVQRVSGRFRVDDTELLARRLGALFARDVETGSHGEIVLGPGGQFLRTGIPLRVLVQRRGRRLGRSVTTSHASRTHNGGLSLDVAR
jgi:hypothetical protein